MTVQVKNMLIVDGRRRTLRFGPRLPPKHPDITRVPEDELSTARGSDLVSTSRCWSGFQATWAIREKRLWLVDIIGRYRIEGDHPIYADWVTGRYMIDADEGGPPDPEACVEFDILCGRVQSVTRIYVPEMKPRRQ